MEKGGILKGGWSREMKFIDTTVAWKLRRDKMIYNIRSYRRFMFVKKENLLTGGKKS